MYVGDALMTKDIMNDIVNSVHGRPHWKCQGGEMLAVPPIYPYMWAISEYLLCMYSTCTVHVLYMNRTTTRGKADLTRLNQTKNTVRSLVRQSGKPDIPVTVSRLSLISHGY